MRQRVKIIILLQGRNAHKGDLYTLTVIQYILNSRTLVAYNSIADIIQRKFLGAIIARVKLRLQKYISPIMCDMHSMLSLIFILKFNIIYKFFFFLFRVTTLHSDVSCRKYPYLELDISSLSLSREKESICNSLSI